MIVYRCRVCGRVLYVHSRDSKPLLSPREVVTQHRYRCPSCGSELKAILNPHWREHVFIGTEGGRS
ncbi:MAG: hypothetical protein QW448_08865 [Thermofilaceae archaeon]